MPIKKLTDIIAAKTGANVLITADPAGEGTTDHVPQLSMHYVELPPGGEVAPHTHDRVEVYLFLTGRARVMTGDEIEEVTTGDVAYAPIGVPHGIKVIGSEPLRFYAFNAPPASTAPVVSAENDVLWRWNRS
jgi:mannose-6-phosphate isomerase-like protein (cupin superfamily)